MEQHPDANKEVKNEQPCNPETDLQPAVGQALESVKAQAESALSPVDLDFKVEDGKVLLTVNHQGSAAGAELKVTVNSDYLLDKLEAAIPGDWDKGVIAIIKVAIANVKL